MNNTRFATAVHILTLLGDNPGEWLSSDYIAGSISVNPVIVRKELSVLSDAGLVITRKGKTGGAQLNKSAEAILMSDIYRAVKNTEVLGKKNQHTNPKCPIGKQINDKLIHLFNETDNIVIQFLDKKTLAEFIHQFH